MLLAFALTISGLDAQGSVKPSATELQETLYVDFNGGLCGVYVCNDDPNLVRIKNVRCASDQEALVTCRYKRKVNNIFNPGGGAWYSAVTTLKRETDGRWVIVQDKPNGL